MATTYKYSSVQGTGSSTTYATLYNTAASTTAVLSTIAIANRAASPATYRVAVMGSAGTPAASDGILAWDATVQANDTVFLTIGAALGNSKYVRVSSSTTTVTFTTFASEIS